MRPIVLVLSATALIAASSQPIRADPIRVDQVSALPASEASTAQSPSMVVGISGQLVALEVFLSRWNTGGAADASAAASAAPIGDVSNELASRTITPFGMPPGLARSPVQFDLASAQLQVLEGRLLALLEGNPAAGRVDLPAPAMQAGGPSFGPSSLPPAAAGGVGLGPAAFDPPAPTPEPTTIALVGSGLLLGAIGRRRARQRNESIGK